MATRSAIGNAVATKYVRTITIADTWAAADTATLTINGKDLVITIGSLVTTTQVATTIKEAFNSSTLTDTTASVLPAAGGQSIPEFAELVATSSGAVVTLTAVTAGVLHVVTESETTAGTGTATGSTTVTATGPNHWSNTDNWAEGSVPVSTDAVICDRPVSLLYDIDQNAVTLASLTFTERFTGDSVFIGLPVRNASGYEEYREDELKISSDVITIRGGSKRLKLNTGSVQTALSVHESGNAADTGRGAIQWRGTHASNVVNVYGGSFCAAANGGDVATIATYRQTAGTAVLSSGCTLTTIDKSGGTLTTDAAATTVTNDGGTITIRQGAHTTLNANGGTINYPGNGTITNFVLEPGATFNADGSTQTLTITNATIRGGTIIDTAKRITFTNSPTGWAKLTVG
jgi:hypothetical protein